MKFASIVPLIGGETLAMEQELGRPPEYLLSYSPFQSNDQHLVEYYKKRGHDLPYLHLDAGSKHPSKVDIVTALCPCAGLSALSPFASHDNHNNKWMIETAKYVLSEMKPEVFWGENAPQLGGKIGKPVLEELKSIGEDNGYSTALYMTSSHLHGIGQTRYRSFYFFWRGDRLPILPFIEREQTDIDVMLKDHQAPDQADPMSILLNQKKPSTDPFYKYILEELEGGISHKQFYDLIPKTTNILDYIEQRKTYREVSEWMSERQNHKDAERCLRFHDKLEAGGNIMRKRTEIPKGRINAFVGHMPSSLTHPIEDRYLTLRECLSIMGMPKDFDLVGGRKHSNHICQNVPVTTAKDIAKFVIMALNGETQTTPGPFFRQDNKSKTNIFARQQITASDEVFA